MSAHPYRDSEPRAVAPRDLGPCYKCGVGILRGPKYVTWYSGEHHEALQYVCDTCTWSNKYLTCVDATKPLIERKRER